MGTLTANSTRLPEYCEHKLPTSCRLSSIPNCCACADERAHAASYSTYIDGIGFVPRGNRWQRYCWFCKEFWEERVRVSGLRSGQTRIPEVPNQTEFLKKWYEFHRGYRIVIKEDGSEERVAVLGEEFRDVSPGCLPRTLEELRAGRRQQEEVQQVQRTATQDEQQNGQTLEDALEQMFAAVSSEGHEQAGQPSDVPATAGQQPIAASQEPVPSSNIHAQAMNPAGSRNREYQMRRVAALRRELNRMRNGIERVITGLRDLGEEVPNYSDTTESLTALGDTLDTISGAPSQADTERAISSGTQLANASAAQSGTDRTMANLQARVEEARTAMEEARRSRDQAASELDLAEQEFRTSQHRFHQVQREQRTTENYMRIFGTREEVIAQGENYESPIGGMFSRAEERFRAAEEVRREQRTLRQVLEDEARSGGEDELRRLAELEARQRDVWGVPRRDPSSPIPRRTRIDRILHGIEPLPPPPTDNPVEQPSVIDDIDTPPTLIPTSEESTLEEYYALLRQQDRQQVDSSRGLPTTDTTANETPQDNFPQSMLQAIRAARQREIEQQGNEQNDLADIVSAPGEIEDEEDGLSGLVATADFSTDQWWHQDANHIIRALTSDDELRNQIGMSAQEASALLTYFVDDVVSENDRMLIDGLMRNPTIIWRTALPAEWIKRRQEGPTYPHWTFFTGSEGFAGAEDWAAHYNPYMRTEIIAQAFQMSARARYRAANLLTPPECLQMLYRLQAGLRNDADVRILEQICDDPVSYAHLSEIYIHRQEALENEMEATAASQVDDARRNMAQNGDHSRDELDARRRDTSRAFALAAGRQAMQTGSQALLERLHRFEDVAPAGPSLPPETGPYRPIISNRFGRRIAPSGFHWLEPDSDTDSDSNKSDEEPDARGLDAQNAGRPEPKEDEELQVQMECKICYTQISEVACLPCGHLVMCRWCSEQHSPCMQHDQTRPRRAAACPVCRKGIRQKVRVFRA